MGKRFLRVDGRSTLATQEIVGVAADAKYTSLREETPPTVVQRTREIGIRLSIGAAPIRIVGLLVSEIGMLTTAGLALGAAGGFAAARLLTGLLHEVKPSDTISIAAPLGCLLLTCAVSALLPSVRATRVEPTTALRYE